MKKKKYRYNPPRFEYLGAFKLGLRAGKIAPNLTEKITTWEWHNNIPIFFIFYDYEEKEYILYSYHFKNLLREEEPGYFGAQFTFNETPIKPTNLFTDKIINKKIQFKPIFGTSTAKLDLWIAKYIIAVYGDLHRGEASESFYFEPKKSGHVPAESEIYQRMNATIESYIQEFAEPFKDFEFEQK